MIFIDRAEEKVKKKLKVVANSTNDLLSVFCMIYVYCVCHSPIWAGVGEEKEEGGQEGIEEERGEGGQDIG